MSPPIDVAAERLATPGSANVAHLNNAGASLATTATLAAVFAHLRLESEIGGYEAEAVARDRLAAVRESAALAARLWAGEVAVTGSDTEGWTKALWGLFLGGGLERGRRILVDRLAYDSHYLGLVQVSAGGRHDHRGGAQHPRRHPRPRRPGRCPGRW